MMNDWLYSATDDDNEDDVDEFDGYTTGDRYRDRIFTVYSTTDTNVPDEVFELTDQEMDELVDDLKLLSEDVLVKKVAIAQRAKKRKQTRELIKRRGHARIAQRAALMRAGGEPQQFAGMPIDPDDVGAIQRPDGSWVPVRLLSMIEVVEVDEQVQVKMTINDHAKQGLFNLHEGLQGIIEEFRKRGPGTLWRDLYDR